MNRTKDKPSRDTLYKYIYIIYTLTRRHNKPESSISRLKTMSRYSSTAAIKYIHNEQTKPSYFTFLCLSLSRIFRIRNFTYVLRTRTHTRKNINLHFYVGTCTRACVCVHVIPGGDVRTRIYALPCTRFGRLHVENSEKCCENTRTFLFFFSFTHSKIRTYVRTYYYTSCILTLASDEIPGKQTFLRGGTPRYFGYSRNAIRFVDIFYYHTRGTYYTCVYNTSIIILARVRARKRQNNIIMPTSRVKYTKHQGLEP